MKLLKPFGTQSFVIGIGIAAATYLLGPSLKRNAKNVAVKGMQGALSAGEVASNAVNGGKDKMTGLLGSMAGTNNQQNQQNQQIAMLYNELKADREQMRELIGTVKDLQEEIAEIKQEEI